METGLLAAKSVRALRPERLEVLLLEDVMHIMDDEDKEKEQPSPHESFRFGDMSPISVIRSIQADLTALEAQINDLPSFHQQPALPPLNLATFPSPIPASPPSPHSTHSPQLSISPTLLNVSVTSSKSSQLVDSPICLVRRRRKLK